MRTTFKWLLCLLALIQGAAAYAQTSCPPGMVPYGTGPGVNMCGYDNSQQPTNAAPQRPAERWVDHWGAIATYGPNGSLGTANDRLSRNQAVQAALSSCRSQHGSSCEVLAYYRNGCGVLVIDGPGENYNANSGATIDEATQKAMATCTKGGYPNCHVYYSGCSLPVRVQ
jgi:hypothetical protein